MPTRDEARACMRYVWVGQHTITREEADRYRAVRMNEDRNLLGTIARIAEVDISKVSPHDRDGMLRQIEAAERATRERERGTSVRATAEAIASGKENR